MYHPRLSLTHVDRFVFFGKQDMSRALIAIALLGLVAAASAYSISRVRTAAPEGWVRLARADPRQVLPFRIALKQRNMDVLEVR